MSQIDMKKKAIMVVGTSSFAGKSLIAAGLCRIYSDMGNSVAPFKAQNMSLNSTVTKDGKEISRSQALQAMAAHVDPESDMNPILLKPMGEGTSQIMLNGKVYKNISAEDYYQSFVENKGKEAVKSAFYRLSKKHDIIIMEGAGSPAEINLYDRDIANLWAAEMADANVLLVADIERGGSFASIYGTIELLRKEHKKRIKGVIINKFRGNRKLLDPGISMIEKLTGVPVIGVVPFIENLQLPDEDSQGINKSHEKTVDIAVIRLPRISNFTDFDPLIFDGRCSVRYVSNIEDLGSPDAIIIPGTKSTLNDLSWLKEKGFEIIKGFQGKIPIIGVCGGFQILGKTIIDKGVEKKTFARSTGLGLLDVETQIEAHEKNTHQVNGKVTADEGIFKGSHDMKIEGYEIHMGSTKVFSNSITPLSINGRPEGAASKDFLTFGTYIHGLFDSSDFREAFISNIMENVSIKSKTPGKDVKSIWEESIIKLARTIKESVDLSMVLNL